MAGEGAGQVPSESSGQGFCQVTEEQQSSSSTNSINPLESTRKHGRSKK